MNELGVEGGRGGGRGEVGRYLYCRHGSRQSLLFPRLATGAVTRFDYSAPALLSSGRDDNKPYRRRVETSLHPVTESGIISQHPFESLGSSFFLLFR